LFLYKITEFFNGDIYVSLNVFKIPPGKQLAFFLGLVLNSIKILSLLLLCIFFFYFVYSRILNVFNELDRFGGES